MSSKRVRVAMIGTGRISDLHAIEYCSNPNAEIVALCDRDMACARLRAASWGVASARIVDDYRAVLSDPDVDLVEILLPHHLHCDVAIAAIDAGKAVSLQKPMCLTMDEADRLVAAAEAGGRPFKVFENFIFYPPVVKAKALIDEGAIGEPLTIRIKSNPGRSDTAWHVPRSADAWRQEKATAGGGTRLHAKAVREFAEAAGAAVILSPGSTGVLPDDHPQNMHVGGSKGTISGNFAMERARLLIVIGSRGVCQSDCSGIGYPLASQVININADLDDVHHYNNTLPLNGDISAILAALSERLAHRKLPEEAARKVWLAECVAKKREWAAFKAARFKGRPVVDEAWRRPVLTQPQAIKTVADFCKAIGALKVFDAGDVQANGFQIVEDDRPGDTITESGASYMGFAVSGLLAAGAADRPRYMVAFTGDGSFMMNPQALIDGIEHGVHATIVLFDNRRMAAISSLQNAQYGREYRTNDSVAVDYVRMAASVAGVKAIDAGGSIEDLAAAMKAAHAHPGLSLVHVPVYFGDKPAGGMGAYGAWNVGNWVEKVQAAYIGATI